MSDLDTKFRERYEVREDGCWEWLLAPGHPYGCFWAGSTPILAHRWAYEHFVGPIPDGLTIDHLCGFTRCVNPDHLEPVTQAENVRRYHRRTTHCPKGHPYDEENTYLHNGKRHCNECRRIVQQERDRTFICEVCGEKRTGHRKRHMAMHGVIGGEVQPHDRRGRIQDPDSYGPDPRERAG